MKMYESDRRIENLTPAAIADQVPTATEYKHFITCKSVKNTKIVLSICESETKISLAQIKILNSRLHKNITQFCVICQT